MLRQPQDCCCCWNSVLCWSSLATHHGHCPTATSPLTRRLLSNGSKTSRRRTSTTTLGFPNFPANLGAESERSNSKLSNRMMTKMMIPRRSANLPAASCPVPTAPPLLGLLTTAAAAAAAAAAGSSWAAGLSPPLHRLLASCYFALALAPALSSLTSASQRLPQSLPLVVVAVAVVVVVVVVAEPSLMPKQFHAKQSPPAKSPNRRCSCWAGKPGA